MGLKKKWKENSSERINTLLNKIEALIGLFFENNGELDLANFNDRHDLEYLIALLINSTFYASKDKRDLSFGADDVIAVKIEVINNNLLKYWGKINWLEKPKDHECFNDFQDPFYAEFVLTELGHRIKSAKFGDFNSTDIEGPYWLNYEINWMYDL